MPSGNVIRGTRIGSAPERPPERYALAPRQEVTYWCRNEHRFDILIAAEAEPPAVWDCPRCGQPGGQDPGNPPGQPRTEPFKSHLAYVKERRTPEEAEAILEEALAALRLRRGRG